MSFRKKHYDRNKTPIHRFSAINKLMAAHVSHQDITESDIDEMELPVLAAIECIAKGRGTVAHYDEIAHIINQSWILCTERGVGEEAKPYLLVAQDGMNRLAARYKKTGKISFDALCLEAVRRVVELWHDQLLLCNVAEVYKAGEIADKHFWNTPAEVT